jgi:hypothetical protein
VWGFGFGVLGLGDWGLGPLPNPQSPILYLNIFNKKYKIIISLFFIILINNNNYIFYLIKKKINYISNHKSLI